jgi:hypothetical protein
LYVYVECDHDHDHDDYHCDDVVGGLKKKSVNLWRDRKTERERQRERRREITVSEGSEEEMGGRGGRVKPLEEIMLAAICSSCWKKPCPEVFSN